MPVYLQTEHQSYPHRVHHLEVVDLSRVADSAGDGRHVLYPAGFTDVCGALGPNSHSLAGQELGVPETRATLVH